MEPIILEPGGGEQVSRKLRLLSDEEPIAITESRYEEGDSGPDAHIHLHHWDSFYVIEGGLVFEVGDDRRRVEAAAGSYVSVPPNVVHTFRNEGPGAARFLNFHTPGCGFGRYLRQMQAGEDVAWF